MRPQEGSAQRALRVGPGARVVPSPRGERRSEAAAEDPDRVWPRAPEGGLRALEPGPAPTWAASPPPPAGAAGMPGVPRPAPDRCPATRRASPLPASAA